MIDGVPRLSASKLLELVDKGEGLTGAHRFFVVFTFPTERETIQSCLDHRSVAGVILADENQTKQFSDPARVGYRFGLNGSRWSLPTDKARAAVVLGGTNSLGLRIAWPAFHHGVELFVFVESETGAVVHRSAVGFMLQTVGQRVRGLSVFSRLIEWLLLIQQERTFRRRLRVMFRKARKIPTEIGPPTDTILLISQNLASGGSQRQAVNIALMLKRAGRLRPVVVCARLGSAGFDFYRQFLENAGIEVVDLYKLDLAAVDIENQKLLDLCKSEGATLGHDILDDLLRYLIVFLKVRPKIVHALLDENNLKAGFAAVLADVPKIILGSRSVSPDNVRGLVSFYMRPGYKVLMARRGVVFYNNSYVGRRAYSRWLLKPPLAIHVVHDGVDFDVLATRNAIDRAAREQFGIPSQALVVVSVMPLSEERQPVLWARAVIEMSRRRPDVYVILVGDGPLRSRVERMLDRASVAGRVCLVPQTPDVPAVLRASDLFLVTPRVEGLPKVLLEAQAVGLPVVTTPAGGAEETLKPGVTGLVARDHSVAAVSNTCLTILDNEALRARMAKAAPEFVREIFSLDRMFKNAMRLYEA